MIKEFKIFKEDIKRYFNEIKDKEFKKNKCLSKYKYRIDSYDEDNLGFEKKI